MSARCNKCGQGEPHLSDSWCLCCCAVEALAGELKCAWGNAGTRAVASDILVSATRQIRAIRRLGIAGAGKGHPAVPEPAGTAAAGQGAPSSERPAPSAERPLASAARERGSSALPPPDAEEVRASVKKEAPAEASASCYSESDESEEKTHDAEVAPGLKAVPKARSEDRREEPSRRRRGSRERGDRRAGSDRAPAPREREDQRSPIQRRHRSRSRHRRRPHRNPDKPRRKRKNHRGGSKHQRLWRAQEDPYRRFHQKQPDRFWDEAPGLP